MPSSRRDLSLGTVSNRPTPALALGTEEAWAGRTPGFQVARHCSHQFPRQHQWAGPKKHPEMRVLGLWADCPQARRQAFAVQGTQFMSRGGGEARGAEPLGTQALTQSLGCSLAVWPRGRAQQHTPRGDAPAARPINVRNRTPGCLRAWREAVAQAHSPVCEVGVRGVGGAASWVPLSRPEAVEGRPRVAGFRECLNRSSRSRRSRSASSAARLAP